MGAYFDAEYKADSNVECPDDDWVKYERWKWFWRDRVKADGSFPDLRAQWLDYQKHFAGTSQSRDNQPIWENEGPTANPSGAFRGIGRTECVAFHPTDSLTFFVGTSAGGIWKTADAGQHYTPLGDDLPFLPISGILIDYQHPDTIYIVPGSRDYGAIGLYRSTDGGNSWAPTGLDWGGVVGNTIYNIVMSPSDPLILFAATNLGVLRSTNGGNTWTNLYPGNITDIKFHPGENATLYAARNEDLSAGHIIKTTDGGDTWTQIYDWQASSFVYNIRLSVTPAAPDWLGVHYFAPEGHYLLSKDGGHTYQDNLTPYDDFGNFSLSAIDSNVVYLGGVSLWHSLNQGTTWKKVPDWFWIHADNRNILSNPYRPSEVWQCNDGGLCRYNESTKQWSSFSNGLVITQFYKIAVGEGAELKIAAGSQDNGGWLRTPDALIGDWMLTNSGDAMCQIIDPTDDNIFYSEYLRGTQIYRYNFNPGGFTSNIALNIPGQPEGEWVTPFILNPQNPKTFIVAFEDLYRSYDRGDHFHKISENFTGYPNADLRNVAMSASDTNVIVATLANLLYITKDGGQTWASKPLSNEGEIISIFIHPDNPQRMWATTNDLSGKKVFTTNDAWLTSENITGTLPSFSVNCIIYDLTTNYLLIGTDIGMFYSDADQINWKRYGQGMPAVVVTDLKIRQATRKLYAGTYGRGVYSVDLETLIGTKDPTSAMLKARVFPNPTHNVLMFKSESEQVFEGKIELFDALGRRVLGKKVASQLLSEVVLDVAGLPAGLYILQAVNGLGHTVLREKVVVSE